MWLPWRSPVDDRPDQSALNVVPFPVKVDKGGPPSPAPSGPLKEVLEAMTVAVKESIGAPSEQDQIALRDEAAFRERFGFDANREQRRQVIAFKHEADVTDAEIRILRKSGSLVYRAHGVEILAPAAIAAWGHVQIVVLGMVMILPIVKYGFKPHFSWPMLLGVLAIEAVLLYFMKLSDDIYIRPHRIRKRVLQQSAVMGRNDTSLSAKDRGAG